MTRSAFPITHSNSSLDAGLSRREYIVTQALVGMLAGRQFSITHYNIEEMTAHAVALADSLIQKLDQ